MTNPSCFNQDLKDASQECFECPIHDLCDAGPEDDDICPECNGSGEGQYDGTKCSRCKGSGCTGQSSNGPSDPPDWWMEEQADRRREKRK